MSAAVDYCRLSESPLQPSQCPYGKWFLYGPIECGHCAECAFVFIQFDGEATNPYLAEIHLKIIRRCAMDTRSIVADIIYK